MNINNFKGRILLIIPPLLQPNAPYPATTVLQGYLKGKGIDCYQMDLGIEFLDRILSRQGLQSIFNEAKALNIEFSSTVRGMLIQEERYVNAIDLVKSFLKSPTPDVAHLIVSHHWLPETEHFSTSSDIEWAFGNMGLIDHAKFLATRFLSSLTELIREAISSHFELIRYGERLALHLPDFDLLQKELLKPITLLDRIMFDILGEKITALNPDVIGFTVPFPGNLYSSVRCAKFIKEKQPDTKILFGGGFINTELRHITDLSLFDYIDALIFDAGEVPLYSYLASIANGESDYEKGVLTKEMIIEEHGDLSKRAILDGKSVPLPTENYFPDFEGLPHKLYFPLVDMLNPMHRLWSDGRWNKMTLAHGCYWARCAFCDTSLPYIGQFGPVTASHLVDRMERIISQTGSIGFHFTDEAAPPALLKSLSLEILKRGLKVVWWTNIRFEKAFTSDLAKLLALAGCIAVTGGIEVASDRLLGLMNKGVSIAQAANTCRAFSDAKIMVHAYLMYGFPTQKAVETVNALEIVRQFFEADLLKSAFWHRFALTRHSPVFQNPRNFNLFPLTELNAFANNEVAYDEPDADDYDRWGNGLRVALYNYMNSTGFDIPLKEWFDFNTPKPTVSPTFVVESLSPQFNNIPSIGQMVIWPGYGVELNGKKGKIKGLSIKRNTDIANIRCNGVIAELLYSVLTGGSSSGDLAYAESILSWKVAEFVKLFTEVGLTTADLIWGEQWLVSLREKGLLIV